MGSYAVLSRAIAPSRRRLILTCAPTRRSLSTTSARRVANDDKRNPFLDGPAPPRLPEEEQRIFEELQRQSTGAFSTPRTPPKVNQSPDSQQEPARRPESDASAQGEELHPNLRAGAKPEFEGDKNPKTGEIGGPKNEPLRWGHNGDWSFNGRVTDF
jgi:hypothetical protein